jgi:hypothetical protein
MAGKHRPPRKQLPSGVTLHPGHGEPCGTEALDWQDGYINTFLDAVATSDWSEPDSARQTVIARMLDYLPSSALQFLMELSIDPVAKQLGVH